MSAQFFRCDEHIIAGQHIRGYYRSTSENQEEELRLHVKQYTPLDNARPRKGDVTLIAAHACGFFKELYEPFFDELYHVSKRSEGRFRIRAIWILDIATHGTSSILNEGKLGIDPSWNDTARDILNMVNVFRKQMPQPILGLGHSMGGADILNVAFMHPRLFTSVVCIEPIVNKTHTGMNFAPAYWLTFRNDVWASREDAMAESRKSPLHKPWDPRVMQRWEKYGFRELPTLLYPDTPQHVQKKMKNPQQKPVTFTTTKHHDVRAFSRGAFPEPGAALNEFHPTLNGHPDLSKAEHDSMAAPLYRPEAVLTFRQLPFLRPSCLYIYGAKSTFSSASPQGRADKMDVTGTAVGGSGGVAAGKVSEAVLQDGGHFMIFEKPSRVADTVGQWVAHAVDEWAEADRREFEQWSQVPVREKAMVDKDFQYWINKQYGRKPAPKKPEQKKISKEPPHVQARL